MSSFFIKKLDIFSSNKISPIYKFVQFKPFYDKIFKPLRFPYNKLSAS